MDEPHQHNVPNKNNKNRNVNNNLHHDNDDLVENENNEDKPGQKKRNHSNLMSIQQGEDTKPKVSTPDNQQCEYQRSIHRRNRCTNSIEYVPFQQ